MREGIELIRFIKVKEHSALIIALFFENFIHACM